ncbi:MAG TPA: hypothetical protein PLR74_15640, partial [Agriterribacter sp.]|nr:hypothetical protein [Agriterribacter sp.]
RDNDPFQKVKEWWNSNGRKYDAPSEDLFKKLGIRNADNGLFVKSGKGWVSINRNDPKELVLTGDADGALITQVKEAFEDRAKAGRLIFKNNFLLRRGPYIVAAVMDENADSAALVISGPVIDLFNPALPVLDAKAVQPGRQAFLYDLKTVTSSQPRVLAAAARVYAEKMTGNTYSFTVKSPEGTINAMRIRLPAKPQKTDIKQGGEAVALIDNVWDAGTKTVLLRFQNYSDGVDVKIYW